jgi:gluconolactonase
MTTSPPRSTPRPRWQPASQYPDPAIRILDPRFEKYWIKLAAVERLVTGMRWCEGPVWFGDARTLIWSDIPNNRMMRWDEETGQTSVFRKPSNFANGNTRDRHGRLITCEHGGRRITRTEYDGTITVLIDRIDGRRLNSPNDIIVKSDGSIWFTDPTFGIQNDYEGHKAEPELAMNVYRLDPITRRANVVAEGILGPNGLAFSPDERLLYIVESRGVPNRRILSFDVAQSPGIGQPWLLGRRTAIDCGPGTADGFRVDVDGNLWCGWGMGTEELDGVRVFAPDGKPLAHIALPERCANLCFGGPKRNRLFMAASQSIYALYVDTQGAPGG